MSLTHSDPSAGEHDAPVEPRDVTVEFTARGKTPDEARVELFSSLTRLEPTTMTERMLERAPEPSITSFEFLPRTAVVTTDSLPYAPVELVPIGRPRTRRPAVGLVAAGVVSAGFAVTLFASSGSAGFGFGFGSSRADLSAPSALSASLAVPGSSSDIGGVLGTSGALSSSGASGSSAESGPIFRRGDRPAGTTASVQPVRAMFTGGQMVLTGAVPSRADADALVARTADILGPDAVVDQLTIDPAAPSVTAVPVHVAERVRFSSGSSAIDSDYVALVSGWRDVLAAVPWVQMKVTGFTDDRGSAEVNDQLALERAQGVADWMQTQGIDGQRIEVSGGGATSPVASNDTPEGRAENRRIQVELEGLLVL